MPRTSPARDWPKLLDEQRRSGLSLYAWCLARRLPLATAYQWRRMLRELAAYRATNEATHEVATGTGSAPTLGPDVAIEAGNGDDADESPASCSDRVPAGFVQLTVVGPRSHASPMIRIRVAGDRVIEVPSVFDDEHLRRVVRVLEGLPCS